MLKLPFLNSKKEKFEITPEDNIVAVDIGTEVLKTVLFNVTDLGVKVTKVSRIKQQQHAVSKGVIKNLNTVIENTRLAINELTHDLPDEDKPKHTVMGIAGEYIQGVSIIVNYEREEKYNQEVTEQEEENIIRKVHEQISEEGKEDLARRTGMVREDIDILHITVTGMEIGGMSVDSLKGFRGKKVRLYFYASFAPKTYIEALKSVAESLGMNLLGVVAQPFAVARAYAGARNKDFSAIFVDIGGGTTDVAVVKNGSVIDTQMYGFGGRVFTKEIARALNIDYRHAELRKLKYSEGNLDKKLHSEVRTVMNETCSIWVKGLRAALSSVEDIEVMPTQIYLCGGGALLPDIKSNMLEYPWTQLLPFPSVPNINIFLPERLYEIIDESGELKNAYDVTPAALARFAYDKLMNPQNYFYNNSEYES
jgi:cell division protein FtsA